MGQRNPCATSGSAPATGPCIRAPRPLALRPRRTVPPCPAAPFMP